MPKVSVIMSIYKEPVEWIRQSIDSILTQTFSDFEFIIVNDKPDRIENQKLLDEYTHRDQRIVVITNESNIGLTKSLNKALYIAKGEYIARMDADDISLSHRFKRQVSYLDSHKNVIVVGSWLIPINELGEKGNAIARYETNSKWVRSMFIQNSQINHPVSMFRRTINGTYVRYDETVSFAQDYMLWASLLPYGNMVNIPDILLYWRSSNQQISSSKFVEQQICAMLAKHKVFDYFGLQATETFFKIYHYASIHKCDEPFEIVVTEFKTFFKKVKYNLKNALVLELILSTYISFIKQSRNGFLKNSSPLMLYLGICLLFHLATHKIYHIVINELNKSSNKHYMSSL